VARIRPLNPPERILIVTGSSHAAELARQLPEIPSENLLVEPVGRNTAPCIGLAALHIQRRAGDGVMVCLPADHRIGDEAVFRRVLAAAGRAAATGSLVTVGIRPTGPETGYGYIEQGEPLPADGPDRPYRVRSIREKPDQALAEAFLKQGNFVWNSGIFLWKASTILAEIERHLPELHQGLLAIRPALATDQESEVVARVYQGLAGISIDYGVMEKAREVVVFPGAFDWSDLGSWDTLWEVLPKDSEGNAARGEWIGVEARGSLVHSAQRLVALVGVEDLLVVDTPDALLICRRGRSQEVRQVVEVLERRGLATYL
jgi:mannose-1-phosphate guanylyltransferase